MKKYKRLQFVQFVILCTISVTHQGFLKTSGHFEANLEVILKIKGDNAEVAKTSASGQIQLILKKVRHF